MKTFREQLEEAKTYQWWVEVFYLAFIVVLGHYFLTFIEKIF